MDRFDQLMQSQKPQQNMGTFQNPIPAVKQFVQERPAFNAIAQAPMQRGNTAWAGMEAIRNTNNQNEQNRVQQHAARLVAGGMAPDEARKIAEFQNMLMHTAMGASVSMSQPNMNVSDYAELRKGWIPGMKTNFDFSVLQHDSNAIKQLLPRVPVDYLTTGGFGPKVYDAALLGNKPALFKMLQTLLSSSVK